VHDPRLRKKKKGDATTVVASPRACLVREAIRYVSAGATEAADCNSTHRGPADRDSTKSGATDRKWQPAVDRDDRSAIAPGAAWIAVVNVADNSAANYRRPAARIGNRDWLRPRRDRSVERDFDWSGRYRLDLRLGYRGGRFSLNHLRRRFACGLVALYARRCGNLANWRSGALDRGDQLLPRGDGTVAKGDSVGRGSELQIFPEIGIDRALTLAIASGQENDTHTCEQQIRLPHLELLPSQGNDERASVLPSTGRNATSCRVYRGQRMSHQLMLY
jgi:hypothetical protein